MPATPGDSEALPETALGCRIGSCVILKLFLIWVIGNYASGDSEYPVWKGWAIAAGLGGTGYVMTLLHHQIFWCAPALAAHSA